MVFSSAVLEFEAAVIQIKHNKVKKSVYGISCDYHILCVVAETTSLISTVYYSFDSQIALEYSNRFPRHPRLNVSREIFIMEVCMWVAYCSLVWQIFTTYKRTMHTFQGFSKMCQSILVLLSFFLIFVRQKLDFLLDVLDTAWFVSKCSMVVRLLPQCFLNWSGDCVVGYADHWLSLQWLSWLFLVVGKYWSKWDFPWHELPVNFPPWPSVLSTALFLLVMTIQRRVYKGNKVKLQFRRKPVIDIV